jgi:hypothetical protein
MKNINVWGCWMKGKILPYLLGYGFILATLEGGSMVDKVLQVVEG